MKKTPKESAPYSAKTQILKFKDGTLIAKVIVTVKAPSRVEVLLNENHGLHTVRSATILDVPDVSVRARGWKCKISKLHTLALAEGLDGAIRVAITPEEWHLVGLLCGRLGITAGDWYLGCAAYNAGINEQEIDEMLENIPVLD
jgi:hypothetical protein